MGGRNRLAGIMILVVAILGLLVLFLGPELSERPSGPPPASNDPLVEEPGRIEADSNLAPPGPTVEVLVLTSANEPARDADLRVWSVHDRGLRYPPKAYRPHDHRRTDEEGRARVPLLPEGEHEYLFAAARGEEEGETRAMVEPDRVSPVVVRLSPGDLCTVYVIDEAGDPAAGCRVQWYAGLSRVGPRSEALTDADGTVRFVRRPGHRTSVIAMPADGTASVGAGIPAFSSSVTLQLEDHEPVRGLVLGAGDVPLPGAHVRLFASVSLPNWFKSFDSEVVTGPDGRFELSVARSCGRMTIFVEAPGHHRDKRTIRFEPGAIPEEDIVLKLRPSSSLTVRLVGVPEESRGAVATVRLKHMIPLGAVLTAATATGECVLAGVPDGDYLVAVELGAVGLAGSGRVTIASATTCAHEIEVELGPAASCAGTLLGPAGEPVAGLEVRLSQDEKLIAETRSDENGRFALSTCSAVLEGGALWIRTPVSRHPLWIGPASRFRAENDEVLTLTGLRRLSAVLRWEDGTVVAGGRVAVLSARASPRTLRRSLWDTPTAITDREGRFQVWVSGERGGRLTGLVPGALPAVVEQDEVLESGELVLTRGQALTGRVLTATGEPVTEAPVSLLAVDGPKFATTTVSRPDGTFTFGGLEAEVRYQLTAYVPGCQARTVVVESIPPTPVVLRVESASGITGVVRLPDGADVGRGQVRAIPTAGQKTSRTGYLGAGGRFRIDGLAPGAYLLRATATPREGVGSGGVDFWAREDVAWTSPGEPCEITVEPAGIVSGVVSGADGAPIPDAYVRVAPGPGVPSIVAFRLYRNVRCRTDPAGAYRIGVPTDQPVSLDVSARGFLRQRVVAVPGKKRDVMLSPAAKLTGTTLDGAGRPVGNVLLVVVPDGGGVAARKVIRSNAGGKFSVGCEPGKEHRVYADGPWTSETVTTTVPADVQITVRRRGE